MNADEPIVYGYQQVVSRELYDRPEFREAWEERNEQELLRAIERDDRLPIGDFPRRDVQFLRWEDADDGTVLVPCPYGQAALVQARYRWRTKPVPPEWHDALRRIKASS